MRAEPRGRCSANNYQNPCPRWPGVSACCLISCGDLDCPVKCTREDTDKCPYLGYGRWNIPIEEDYYRKLPKGEKLGGQ